MAARGKARFWLDGDGWGIIDSDQTPGGCWAHFSSVDMPGYRILAAGQQVLLEWECADQHGYAFRAVSVPPAAS